MTLQQKKKSPVTLYVMMFLTALLMILTMLFLKYPLNANAKSNADKPSITLNGPWKFRTGDNLKWSDANFNDSKWEIINLSAPAGLHDGDVGLSNYVPGWTARGYPKYSGYAWYRMNISLDSLSGTKLALLGPAAVDDAYQLFINGSLLGSAGDFSGKIPKAFSIQPRIFLLPDASVNNQKDITIAFRVWMSAGTLGQAPALGGIHIAPEIGTITSLKPNYRFRWEQVIKGYIVEVVEPVLFIILAIVMFSFFRSNQQYQSCKWFVIGLVLLALMRANQAIFYWLQIETAQQFDIFTTVTLKPLILGSWVMAWREWFKLSQPRWIPKITAILTSIYMGAQLLGLTWVSDSVNETFFQKIADYTRLTFVALMLSIIYQVLLKKGKKEWLAILALSLVSIGLFAQEVASLHIIPGIWFPYGVGVSLTQYVYAAFVLMMYILLIQSRRKANASI